MPDEMDDRVKNVPTVPHSVPENTSLPENNMPPTQKLVLPTTVGAQDKHATRTESSDPWELLKRRLHRLGIPGVVVLIALSVWWNWNHIGDLPGIPPIIRVIQDWFTNEHKGRKEQDNSIKVKLNGEYNILNSSDDFTAIISDIFFKIDTEEKVTIKLEITEDNDFRVKLNGLLKREGLSAGEKEERNRLQKFLSDRDRKLDRIAKIIERTVKNTKRLYSATVTTPDDWKQVISGILEHTTRNEIPSGAIKLDMWMEEPCHLTAPIFVTEEEMTSLTEQLGISAGQLLGRGGYYASDLPRKVLLRKGVPAITVSLHDAIEAKKCSSNEMETEYLPSTWYIGLG